jgi:hypothetical protein
MFAVLLSDFDRQFLILREKPIAFPFQAPQDTFDLQAADPHRKAPVTQRSTQLEATWAEESKIWEKNSWPRGAKTE